MPDRPWKALEREVGRLIDGARYPANQGGKIDVESDKYVVQVKHRRSLSLEQVTQLVEEMDQIGQQKSKVGMVVVKCRRGTGKPSPLLVVMSAQTWVSDIAKGPKST